ncbi:MAG: V-type ATP synthase subunit F [Candidatus Woesearchaeota archaeon]
MAELAVIGDSEFVLGFELIGLNVYEADSSEKLKESFLKAMNDKNIGIIVTNDKSLQKLEPNIKRQVENSVNPVLVVLSDKSGAQENLREMIKKAIGIDLWSK